MTSTYLKQFTPRISQAGRELVKLWNLKRALNKARPFEVKTDLMYVMTVGCFVLPKQKCSL